MKHIKRYGLGLVALVSLLSVVFITAAPNNVVGQDVAATAAVKINWATSADQDADDPAVFSIEYDSTNCNSPVGGTLHGGATGATSSEDAVLGLGNDSYTILTTHYNLDDQAGGTHGNNADGCNYFINVTASLNCAFVVSFGTVDVLTVAKTDTGDLSSGRLRVEAIDSSSSTFFANPIDNLAGASVGTLNYFDSDGDATAVAVDASGNIDATAEATDCDAPPDISGFAVHNAEPEGSLELSVVILPQRNCQPDDDFGEIRLAAGTQDRTDDVIVDDACTYTLSVQHSSTQPITEDTAIKSQCEVVGVLYELDINDALTATRVSLRETDNPLDIRVVPPGRRVSRTSGILIAQITLFVSNTCPQTAAINLQYEVLDSTEASLRTIPVDVRITPAANAHSSCMARPSFGTIEGASDDRVDTVVSFIFIITTRPRTGRTCSYTIRYPLNAGSLSLAAEPGHNYKTGTGASTVIAPPTNPGSRVSAPDGRLDGQITQSAITLRSAGSIRFVYEARKVPITVSTNFPDGIVFTTQDLVDYRITVIGPCARFSEIIARALGGSGSYRSIQAYPGTTLVYDRSLQDLTSSNSRAGEELYEIDPVVIVDGSSEPCTIQVEEVFTPPGCSVIDGAIKTVTFAEGLEVFSFLFEHTCSGGDSRPDPGVPPKRGLTS